MNGVTSFGDAIHCPEIYTSTFLMKGTDIDMQGKITNCAEGSEKDDVVTIKGLSIYYRKETVLDLQGQRITNVAAGSEPTDAVNLTQARTLVSETIDTRLNDLSSEYYREGEDLSMGNNLIRNLHQGILGTDAVNKGQVF